TGCQISGSDAQIYSQILKSFHRVLLTIWHEWIHAASTRTIRALFPSCIGQDCRKFAPKSPNMQVFATNPAKSDGKKFPVPFCFMLQIG
ncbi:hypothetical protein, partial [Pseudochrobactrum lubricantis]|uniref:hypothetical protein n=1 Tax=Pseudochrobactrum lubricantis TaxID=558172 RepID=UPI0035DAE5FA